MKALTEAQGLAWGLWRFDATVRVTWMAKTDPKAKAAEGDPPPAGQWIAVAGHLVPTGAGGREVCSAFGATEEAALTALVVSLHAHVEEAAAAARRAAQ